MTKYHFIARGSLAVELNNAIHVMVFDNPEFGQVRTILNEKGEPLFCSKDVCDALGYCRSNQAVYQHVNEHDAVKHCIASKIRVSYSHRREVIQNRLMIFVNENGLYSLIFGSKKKSAQRFKLWVTSVVLPQIRKTGGYIPVNQGDTEEEMRQKAESVFRKTENILRSTIEEKTKLIAEQDERIRQLNEKVGQQVVKIQKSAEEILSLEGDIDRLMPKAFYADNVLDSISCFTTTQIAKELGMTARELNRALCSLHVQYYQSGQYLLYAHYAHQGLAKSRTRYGTEEVYGGCGQYAAEAGSRVKTQMYLVWTEKGRRFIHDLDRSRLRLLGSYSDKG